jgi:hypothetical protein
MKYILCVCYCPLFCYPFARITMPYFHVFFVGTPRTNALRGPDTEAHQHALFRGALITHKEEPHAIDFTRPAGDCR